MNTLPIDNLMILKDAKKSRGVGVTTKLAEICQRRPEHTYLVVRDLNEAKRVNEQHGIRAIPLQQVLKGSARADDFTSYIFDPDALFVVIDSIRVGLLDVIRQRDEQLKEAGERIVELQQKIVELQEGDDSEKES